MRIPPVTQRSPSSWAATGAAVVGAAIPAVVMLRLVWSGPDAQYADYWQMVSAWARPDGWLGVDGLLDFYNGHPMAVAKVIYWLNSVLAHGSNRTLGLYVMAVVVAQLAFIAYLVRHTPSLRRWSKAALIVLASALLFSRQGTWNFALAMSGTGWLTANMVATGAVLARHRDRRFLSAGLGVIASFSYGTGLAVWPALVMTGWARDRSVRSQWPTLLVGSIASGWYLRWYSSSGSSSIPVPDLSLFVRYMGLLVGQVVTPDTTGSAIAIGLTVTVVAAAATTTLLVRGDRDVAGWIGIAIYAFGSAVLITRSRALLGVIVSDRYMSISALAILVTTVLVAHLLAGERVPLQVARLSLVGVLLALVVSSGATQVRTVRARTSSQEALDLMLRIGRADGMPGGLGDPFPPITNLLEQIGHHPFDGPGLDCGLIGSTLASAPIDSDLRASVTLVRGAWGVPDVTETLGWMVPAGRSLDCLVVVDSSRRVIGAGATGSAAQGFAGAVGAPPGAVGFVTRSLPGRGNPTVLVRFDGDTRFSRVPAPG